MANSAPEVHAERERGGQRSARPTADALDTSWPGGVAPGVIVLAGGFGTRLRGVLEGIPKPLAPVAGRPFVEWIVRFFARYGCTEFSLATGYLAEQIEAHFATQPVPGVRVQCHCETTPLGTAGGARNTLPDIPTLPIRPSATLASGATAPAHWLVVNGDSLVFADPRPLLAPLAEGEADAALLGLHVDDASRYGTLALDARGHLTAFREKQPGVGVINAGVYAFTHATLAALPTARTLSFEHDVFPTLAARGRVAAHVVSEPFLDIGLPATLAAAADFITAHLDQFAP